jgi:hypothetical protein
MFPQWRPDSAEVRADLLFMFAVGNETCDEASHWLEEREDFPS